MPGNVFGSVTGVTGVVGTTGFTGVVILEAVLKFRLLFVGITF